MNTNKILVYGERLGDLLEADEQMTACRPGGGSPPGFALTSAVAMLRAVLRAEAEILLEVADSGRVSGLHRVREHLLGLAYLRVIDEACDVAAEPLTLRSHPALAHPPARRQEIETAEETV